LSKTKSIQVTNVQAGDLLRHIAKGLMMVAEIISPVETTRGARK